jgi:16S rRNA (guanine527-N7)-methyltransferase
MLFSSQRLPRAARFFLAEPISMADERELRRRMERGCRQLDLTLSPQQVERLLALVTLLTRWNRAFNLTAIREPRRMVSYHILDSLALNPYVPGGPVLDIGTGAGFPGLPLAVLHPDWHFVLLDGNGKKIRFVRQAVMELELGNVEPIRARIESYPCSEKFVTILARAFAPLSDILRLATPLLQLSGVLLAAKGPSAPLEIARLGLPAGRCRHFSLQIPFLEARRSLVEIRLGGDSSNLTSQR